MADGLPPPPRERFARDSRPAVPPGALKREDAARYVGVGATTFDELVRRGEMPFPRRYRSCNRIVWLTRELDQALEDLPSDDPKPKHQPADYDL